jgi:hypothetical protein
MPASLPAHAVASLLSLLDAADAELALHVSQVKAVIKEARGSLDAYRKQKGDI